MITKQVYSVGEVCEILDLGRPLVYRLLAEGSLPGRKMGRKWVIPKVQIERMLKGGKDDS